MVLDIYTLLVILGVGSIIQFIVLWWYFFINKNMISLHFWTKGAFFTAIGMLALFLRVIIHLDFVTIIVANAFITLGELYRYRGIVEWVDRKEKKWISPVIFSIYFVVYTYFTYIHNNQAIRIVASSLIILFLSMASFVELWQAKERSKNILIRGMGGLLGVNALFNLFRAVVTGVYGVDNNFFNPSMTQSSYLAYTLVSGLLWTYGVLLVSFRSINLARDFAQEKFKLIYDTSPDIAFTTNLKTGQIEEVNDACVKMSGYEKKELLHQTIQELHIWGSNEDRDYFIKTIARDGFCDNLQLKARKRDGTILQMLISSRIMEFQGRKFLMNVARDITDLKKIEDQVRVLSQAVKQSPVSIIITDVHGNIEFVNQKFIDLTGYSFEEVLHNNPRFLNSRTQPDTMYQELWNTVLGGKEWKGEFHNKKKNGELYWESASVSPIINEEDQIIQLLAIKQDVTLRKQLEDELLMQATTDVLTGLANRRHFIASIENELERNLRHPKENAFFMIDIDMFKHVNDNNGHLVGDQALQLVAQACKESLRTQDLVGRIGGEEFAVFLSETAYEDALQIAERLRKSVSDIQLFGLAQQRVHLSISIGVTKYVFEDTLQNLMTRADHALYYAKDTGRNKVVAYEMIETEKEV